MPHSTVTTHCYELYSDASFDPKSGLGIGAFLAITSDQNDAADTMPADWDRPTTKSFRTTSCARLELSTVLWALTQFEEDQFQAPRLMKNVTIYTDSQAIAGLGKRRTRLESNQFLSGRTGLPLSNGDLYQEYYAVWDRLNSKFTLQIKWVKGHSEKQGQTREEAIFARVDRESRAELRRVRAHFENF